MSLRPSEYVHRQLKFTPLPAERVGWILEQVGPQMLMFSSDYPHVEGGRDPLSAFERELASKSEEVKERFYRSNFADFLGSRLSAGGTADHD